MSRPESEAEDRLSNLPDSLIHHIFSFIDSLYLVRASSLAHRWRHLYASTPTLSLSFYNVDDGDWMLPPRRGLTQWIFEAGTVEAFVSAAAERGGLERLDLTTNLTTFRLPTCLCTTRSLKELTLRSDTISLPKDVGFPLLKKLHLEHGHPLSAESFDGSIISRCPNLEILILRNCNIGDITKTLHISAPKLISLTISTTQCLCPFPKKDWEFVIKAPRLTSFSFSGVRALNCHLASPCSSLDEVQIHVFESTYKRIDKALGLIVMLNVFKCARTIKLSQATDKYLSEARELFQVVNSSSNYNIFCHSQADECISKL